MQSNELRVVGREGKLVLINSQGKYLQSNYSDEHYEFSNNLTYAASGSTDWLRSAADLIGFKVVK